MLPSPHCHPEPVPAQATGQPLAWLVPAWPAPAHVRALCTARAGGVSEGAFAQMNLGAHVGDVPEHVAANRARLAQVLGARPVFLNQVHGCGVVELQPGMADGAAGDAVLSDQPALACTILVADCLPVLLTDRAGRAVAAAHAGWRGLAGGVLEAVLEHFWALAPVPSASVAHDSIAAGPVDADGWLAWLGPCIGPQAFEVGAEVRDAFCAADGAAAAHFAPQPGGKFLANLPALARQRLARLGVREVYGNDGSAQWCTVTQSSRFFSHRRDGGPGGGTGRMAACIWLAGSPQGGSASV